jgi:hypothetical protein
MMKKRDTQVSHGLEIKGRLAAIKFGVVTALATLLIAFLIIGGISVYQGQLVMSYQFLIGMTAVGFFEGEYFKTSCIWWLVIGSLLCGISSLFL